MVRRSILLTVDPKEKQREKSSVEKSEVESDLAILTVQDEMKGVAVALAMIVKKGLRYFEMYHQHVIERNYDTTLNV